MTATEALERRIDELCSENERLRSCLSDDADNAREIMAENKRLRQDNAKLRGARDVWQENDAKLRELVRYAYECAIHSDHATCDDCRRMNGYCILERRMRELGIEVDE